MVNNEYIEIPLSNMRKVIAKRLADSKREIPHYYLTMSIEMDEVMKVRGELNKSENVKISVNDLLIKAAALSCIAVP